MTLVIEGMVSRNLKRMGEKKVEISNHAKLLIIDDTCFYTGSQNLYVCPLVDWGVIIDDAETTAKIMDEYWNPMWKASYNEHDCKVTKKSKQAVKTLTHAMRIKTKKKKCC